MEGGDKSPAWSSKKLGSTAYTSLSSIGPTGTYIWAAKTAKIQLLLTNQSSRESINHFTLPINQLVKLINLPNN